MTKLVSRCFLSKAAAQCKTDITDISTERHGRSLAGLGKGSCYMMLHCTHLQYKIVRDNVREVNGHAVMGDVARLRLRHTGDVRLSGQFLLQ